MNKKKLKIFFIITFILVVSLNISSNYVYANNELKIKEAKHTKEYEEWLNLSEEEKSKTIKPRMYEIEDREYSFEENSLLKKIRLVKAGINPSFNLKDIIPNNMKIKNQLKTNSCWAFSTISSLETNLALSDYKNGINGTKIYDFSERHMEYATSKLFKDGKVNEKGYDRKVGSGGTFAIAESYLINGMGAINEQDMPFENNEDLIDISTIQNKVAKTQIYDTVLFPDYQKSNEPEKIKNRIKEHIQNYGSIYTNTHVNFGNILNADCYNQDTGAKFCSSESAHKVDHAVSIVGWDDNYSRDNFNQKNKPKSNGAWIAKNSWGENIPSKGYMYISYEDVNVSKEMAGIIKAKNELNYDNLYYYNDYIPVVMLDIEANDFMFFNVFNKKTNKVEYLNQVSINAPEQYTASVYFKANGMSENLNDYKLVELKNGIEETFDAGYHTFEFKKPIEITENSFTVGIKIKPKNSNVKIIMESKVDSQPILNSVITETEKCYCYIENKLGQKQIIDLGKINETNPTIENGDSTIKAFTTNELNDGSLKSIEIIKAPNKINYFEGENFDSTGMIIQANYNSKEKPSEIIDITNYSILNATNLKVGQTSITISFKNKEITQPIKVEKNSVVKLTIKNPPTKVDYLEGENFDKAGMVIEAEYKNGDIKVINNFEVINGNNLNVNQNSVSILIDNQKVEQQITVKANPLVEIKIIKGPDKIKYIEGQSFDKTGLVITGIYQDGKEREIIDYIVENGDNLVKGQASVIIKFNDKIVEQIITVEEKVIVSIEIKQYPSKMEYIQNKENLDLTGGKILINYNDGTNEELNLNSEQILVSGFDNSKLGKNPISVEYLNKIITFDVEIIEEVVAENSNFDNSIMDLNNAKVYFYTDKNKIPSVILNVQINNIKENKQNDSLEYYYSLSQQNNQNNILNWIKIDSNITNGKLVFTINSDDFIDKIDISKTEEVYIYIKEVAKKGNDKKVLIKQIDVQKEQDFSKIEMYVDNQKVNIEDILNPIIPKPDQNNPNANQEDDTMADTKIPQTGVVSVAIIMIIVLVIGGISYIRYKKLNKYIK